MPPPRSFELSVRMGTGDLEQTDLGPYPVLSNADLFEPFGQPPHFKIGLNQLQERSLHWMIQQERAAQPVIAQVIHQAVMQVEAAVPCFNVRLVVYRSLRCKGEVWSGG